MIKRTSLHESLPLETPYSFHVFPSFYCNLKCNYCLHSLPSDELERSSFHKQYMPLDLYCKAIDDLCEFPDKLKALIFAGHGEPLMHRDIVHMVEYAKRANVAERIEIVTNATLLTKKMSRNLVAAGLNRLRISIQGVTSQKYKEVTGQEIDYKSLVEDIAFFYSQRGTCEVCVKVVDTVLDRPEDKTLFESTFEKISDSATIEYIIPFIDGIDYTELKADFTKRKIGGQCRKVNVCSMPFYMMVLNPDGKILPCCASEIPFVLGNVNSDSLNEIWHSRRHKLFLCQQLKGRDYYPVCENCCVPNQGLQDGDYLDNHADHLLKKYEY